MSPRYSILYRKGGPLLSVYIIYSILLYTYSILALLYTTLYLLCAYSTLYLLYTYSVLTLYLLYTYSVLTLYLLYTYSILTLLYTYSTLYLLCTLSILHYSILTLYLLLQKVFNQAEELLRSASQSSRLSLPRIQSGWLIIGAVMTLGPSVVKPCLPTLLQLWKNTFPRTVKVRHAWFRL